MSDMQNYERLLRQKTVGRLRWKKILFLFVYVTWASVWTILMLHMGINAPMLLFIPLTTWGLVWLTWPLVQIEFEYTLAAGTFYLAKIYGKKRRKEIVEAEIRDALLIAPDNEENRRRAEALAPSHTISALSAPSVDRVWLLLFELAPNHRILLSVEMDEDMLHMLRHANPRATARDKLAPLAAEQEEA